MRDKRFVAQHRGGILKKEQHYQLCKWACACSRRVLRLLAEHTDERLTKALEIAEQWSRGDATVGDARAAALAAIAAANESVKATAIAVARCVGHASATAHMADHALAAAAYALKAVKIAGRSTEAERKWQDEQLPAEIRDLVLTARKSKYL